MNVQTKGEGVYPSSFSHPFRQGPPEVGLTIKSEIKMHRLRRGQTFRLTLCQNKSALIASMLLDPLQ